MYEGKRILITGGTGSFGRAMIEHLKDQNFGEIRVFSRDEAKQDAMRHEVGAENVRFFIGDVRDRSSVDRVMHGVDLVFHAAALKQVPTCEFFPLEAVATNVLGSNNVVNSGIEHSVDSVVLLGTDKAVMPVNAMGMSKAMMEKVGQSAARELAYTDSNTTVSIVRYGNVMYSRGSVIPLFVRLLREGQPLTVTEPTMTRFLLPLSEAVQLVEFAFNNAASGDIFIRKAQACTLAVLAEAMQNLFERPVGLKRLGIRHGEKMHETLATSQELRHAEDMGDYYRIRLDDRNLNYSLYFDEGDPDEVHVEEFNSHNAEQLSVDQVEQLLLGLPEIHADLKEMRSN